MQLLASRSSFLNPVWVKPEYSGFCSLNYPYNYYKSIRPTLRSFGTLWYEEAGFLQDDNILTFPRVTVAET